MTQDCSRPLPTADESRRFPKGINITKTGGVPGLGIGRISCSVTEPACGLPWGYISIHNKSAAVFEREMGYYNMEHPEAQHRCFVHRSVVYGRKDGSCGVRKELKPSVSGLVFLQGTTPDLRGFLAEYYPHYHLVNDCSRHEPASIPNAVMKPFMAVLEHEPGNVTFLRDPFEKFARDRVRLRVLTGLFRGCEGYIVRIDRDRQLVLNLGGYAVAIRGVHREDFEEVAE